MDITRIFKSKTRQALLRLCFTNPDNKYYLRELERILGIPVSMIRKELIRLEKEGTFTSKRVANLTYFSPNKSYPLYEEVKSIVFKTIGIQGHLRDALEKIKGIEGAFIFGPFARNEANEKSEIDLFILGNPGERELHEKLRRAEAVLKRKIDTNLYSRPELEKKKKENDPILKKILDGKKVFLIGSETSV